MTFDDFIEHVHGDQKYGDKPYSYHLGKVVTVLAEAGLDSPSHVKMAKAHDAIEDAEDQSFAIEYLKNNLTEHEFKSVWCCTGIGKNRKERNQSIYDKINDYPLAADIKVADRIANMRQGVIENSKQLDKYLKEDEQFRANVLIHCSNKHLVNEYEKLSIV